MTLTPWLCQHCGKPLGFTTGKEFGILHKHGYQIGTLPYKGTCPGCHKPVEVEAKCGTEK